MSNILSRTYEGAVAITASDAVDDPKGPFAALYTGSGGTIKATLVNGETATFVSTVAGTILNIAVKRVWSSTTAATSVLGLKASPWRGGSAAAP